MANTRVTTPVTDFDKTNTTQGLKLPSGTNSNQPSGVQGMIRNDTGETTGGSTSALEHHNGTNWQYFAATESPDVVYPASLKLYLDASNTTSYPGTGNTWFDLTSNGNNGAISGATWNNSGYFDFDGINDYIDLTGNVPFGSSTTQTDNIKSITGWVKLDAGTRAMLYSVSSTASSNDYFSCQIRDTTVFVAGRNGSSSNQYTDTFTTSTDTNWHHYVFQIDGSERQIYIDGVKKTLSKDNRGTATDSSWISYPTYSTSVKHTIQLGRVVSPYYGSGKISKVNFYDTVLTQTEITVLYNEGR